MHLNTQSFCVFATKHQAWRGGDGGEGRERGGGGGGEERGAQLDAFIPLLLNINPLGALTNPTLAGLAGNS